MTKRPSPFETGICRQSKIHVNNYENDLNAQKHVEEKTLKKLLEGSKKLHSIILINGDSQNGDCRKTATQKSVNDYFSVNGKRANENGKRMTGAWDVSNRCSFCDVKGSTHQCAHCLEFYCSSCSFANYESPEDKRICLSCS